MSLKEKLRSGQAAVVVNLDYPSSGLAARLGRLGVDAVFLDCEQGPIGIESVEDLARAARTAGAAALVRLFAPEDWAIERYLGRGIDGIVVPRLDTPDQARRVVEAVRYCDPRGWAERVVVVQIETAAAARAIDGFLALDGIDAFFVGPVDLAKSLGHGGDFRRPEVTAVIDRVIDRTHASGRASGILVDAGSIHDWRRRRVQFLYCHVDDFLAEGAPRFLQVD